MTDITIYESNEVCITFDSHDTLHKKILETKQQISSNYETYFGKYCIFEYSVITNQIVLIDSHNAVVVYHIYKRTI